MSSTRTTKEGTTRRGFVKELSGGAAGIALAGALSAALMPARESIAAAMKNSFSPESEESGSKLLEGVSPMRTRRGCLQYSALTGLGCWIAGNVVGARRALPEDGTMDLADEWRRPGHRGVFAQGR